MSEHIESGRPPDSLRPDMSGEARAAAAIESWKRRLLDLTKRNRALNFRMNPVSTVAVVEEQPAEVFRQLWLRERSMRFKPLKAGQRGHRTDPTDGGDVDGPAMAFKPYEPLDVDERATDDFLQTTSAPDALDKSLRRIDEQARTAIEEQGVNTLFLALGMLNYRETREAAEFLRAPLILLPVALERKSARAGFVVSGTDEDAMANPALMEYLRRTYGISLPDLPDSEHVSDDYDLRLWFGEVASRISAYEGWHVGDDIYLALFAFQKVVMYKDLELNHQTYVQHRLIKQLVSRSGTSVAGLPDDVRTTQLDDVFPPEKTYQVVDADSSQLRAIACVEGGHDLVLEGPPGTGKSQTITNLIAHALANGKRVLFVSEKMAALEVVYTRLARAGLGEFCLELHSTKANKRAVLREIALSLDATLQRPRLTENVGPRLAEVRRGLNDYVNAVHTPYGALGFSPYRAYGELGTVLQARKVRWSGSVEGVTPMDLAAIIRDLEDLSIQAATIGSPASHPWRDTGRTFYAEQDLDAITEAVKETSEKLADVLERAGQVERDFNVPMMSRFADVQTAVEIAGVLGRSPGASIAVLTSAAWNSPPPQAVELVERGRRAADLYARITRSFSAAVTEVDHTSDRAFIEELLNSNWRVVALCSRRYREIKRRWRSYRLPTYHPPLLEQAREMQYADAYRHERQTLRRDADSARELFGELWHGEQSRWDTLAGYIRWVVEFRATCVRHGLKEQAIRVASGAAPDVSRVGALKTASDVAQAALENLTRLTSWPKDYLKAASFDEVRNRLDELQENISLAPQWASFEQIRSRVVSGPAAELVDPAMRGDLAFRDLVPAFRRAFFQKWIAEVVQARASLRDFQTLTHEQRRAEFRRLDQAVLQDNQLRLVDRLRQAVQRNLQDAKAVNAMPYLRKEMGRQRGLSPLRKTMRTAGPAIRAIKPCFLMSPLTVSQFLEMPASFDLVIFDEASQLPIEDAVGAVGRGQQLVVVGDPKQLPPTNFFTVMSGQVTAQVDEDGDPIYEDSESVLEDFLISGAPKCRLKWHYRSTNESLIAFSNITFYDSELYTFPSIDSDNSRSGLQFEFIEDGVYEGKGVNSIEARRVADAVVRHARECPELSLGIGTFNIRQQNAILDELESRRRQDPSLETFFARKVEDGFFVKNLENIQGDERDVIFISVTYGKGRDGRLRHTFGPLNTENGWRRLNVLITRARKRMRVFSSMKGDDINPVAAMSTGPRILREFLNYAERGQLVALADTLPDGQGQFEGEVIIELLRRGVAVQPQIGAAGYRIDIGVLDEARPGRYLCGIECDGVAYHQSETARDRDRLRQQVLEARGWIIYRVWSTDWFKDRQSQTDRLMLLIEEARRRAREESAAEAAADASGAEQQAVTDRNGAEATSGEPTQGYTTSRYRRPRALPYRFAPGNSLQAHSDFYSANRDVMLRAATEIVGVEAPMHIADFASRLAAMWGLSRVGSRILERVERLCKQAAVAGILKRRGKFIWAADDHCVVRSRADTGIPAERIAPEEYDEAVKLVTRAGGAMPRSDLVHEVRAVFGFARTGSALDAEIQNAIGRLLTDGILGEGSMGVSLRG